MLTERLFVCCCFFLLQEISNVLRGALDRLRTDDPPASMSRVNFRYECVQVCLCVFMQQTDHTVAGYSSSVGD